MNKNYKNIFIIIFIIFLMFLIITNKSIVNTSVNYSLNIWVTCLIPSLFPFLVLSNILISYNFINYIPKYLKNIIKNIFSLNDSMLSIFFIAIISGFPTSGIAIKEYYKQNQISISDATRVLLWTHFPNPLFVLNTTSIFFLKDEKLGLVILLSIYLTNFIIALLTRKKTNNNLYSLKETNLSFGIIFINSIKKSINTLLTILGILASFLTFSSLILYITTLGNYTGIIIKGLLEITMGLKDIYSLNITPLHMVILASIFISFGGLSVHMQILNELIDTPLKYRYFLYGRIISIPIIIPIVILLYHIML